MNPDKYSDKALKKLEERIKEVYEQASRTVQKDYDRYVNGWTEIVDGNKVKHLSLKERYAEQYTLFQFGQYDKDKIIQESLRNGVNIERMWYYKDWQNGTLSDKDFFDRWVMTQEGRGKYWKDLQNTLSQRLVNSGKIASGIINGEMPKMYAVSINDLGKKAVKEATRQGYITFRFDMIDDRTLNAILSGKHKFVNIREFGKYDERTKETKVVQEKDYKFNQEKFQRALASGVAAGEGPEEIAKRLQEVVKMKERAAIGSARTAITNAKNAGLQDCMDELAEMGCESTKSWHDVHDSIPPERHAHWEASGQEVPYNGKFIVGGEELEFPGDPRGSAWNIHRCRCRMDVSDFTFKSILPESKRNKIKVRFD